MINLEKLVKISKELKETEQTGQQFHTSFIFRKTKLLVVGINSYQKSELITKLPKYQPYKFGGSYKAGLHSEVAAAKQLDFQCKGLTLVNIRIDNNGKLAYSCPCQNCWEHVVKGGGFKSLIFSTNEGWERIKRL